jgi:hypothetical protein
MLLPSAIRDRYGEEIVADSEELYAGGASALWMALDLVRVGIKLRVHALLTGTSLDPKLRLRHGIALSLWSGLLVVLGGIGFQRNTEHWPHAFASAAVMTPRVLYGATAIFGGALLVGGALVGLIVLPSLLRQRALVLQRIGLRLPVLIGMEVAAVIVLVVGRSEWTQLLGKGAGGGLAPLGMVFIGLTSGLLVTLAYLAWRVLQSVTLSAERLWWVGAATVVTVVLEILVSLSALGWQCELLLSQGASSLHIGFGPPTLGLALMVMTVGLLGALRSLSQLIDVLLGMRTPWVPSR